MKTIKEKWTDLIEANGGKFLNYSSVWNVHHSGIGENKNSAVYKDVQDIFAKNETVKKIWAKVGSHGWSQHSKSDVLLFDVSNVDLREIGIELRGAYFER